MSSKIPDYHHCLQSFPTSRALLAHASCNGEERPFACDQCGKSFLTYGGQCDHEVDCGRPPNERYPHACATCGKRIATRGGLKTHVWNCYERAELKRQGELGRENSTAAQEGHARSVGPSPRRTITRNVPKAPALPGLRHSSKPLSKVASEHSSAQQPDYMGEAVAAESLLALSTSRRDFSIRPHSASGARDLVSGRSTDTTPNVKQASAHDDTPNGEQVPAKPNLSHMQQLRNNQQRLAQTQQNLRSQQQGGMTGFFFLGDGMGHGFGSQQQGGRRPGQEVNSFTRLDPSPPSPVYPDPTQQVNALSRPVHRPSNPILLPSLDFLLVRDQVRSILRRSSGLPSLNSLRLPHIALPPNTSYGLLRLKSLQLPDRLPDSPLLPRFPPLQVPLRVRGRALSRVFFVRTMKGRLPSATFSLPLFPSKPGSSMAEFLVNPQQHQTRSILPVPRISPVTKQQVWWAPQRLSSEVVDTVKSGKAPDAIDTQVLVSQSSVIPRYL
ncbi:hypothetical protein LTR37_016074 [Vermiconidia calcicola]|uniref:Uncharacterized protein n=1 Tax=Vermiconidia calcicola TaxID=1690605 RepID=A0ACC3MNV3_9PEZI|nr:hypothetical protein LTR37_016074 [Vermiconidia calcicola]